MSVRPSYALAIHGGAGVKPGRDYSRVEAHLERLISEGEAMLCAGESALDTVETMVANLEGSGLYVAGRGSAPSRSGRHELDAALMDGARQAAGAVANISAVKHPIKAARHVLEHSPYVLFAGEGANQVARAAGLEQVEDPEDWYTLPVGVLQTETEEAELQHGTVGAVALDRNGNLASATSTGGLFGKASGRIGDTPLIGAGTWASDRVAVSCTGLGEFFILAGTAKDVDARMRYGGETLEHAASASLDDIARLGGDGGLIAIDTEGNMALPFNSDGMKRAWVREGRSPGFAIYS